MIFMPGIVCQGDKRLTWAKYEAVYTEVAGSSKKVKLNYARTKKASTAYTIQNGVYVLTNPSTKTAENLAAGDSIVDASTSNNSATSGATRYKVTKNSGRAWWYWAVSAVGEITTGSTMYGFKSYTQRASDGHFIFSGTPVSQKNTDSVHLYSPNSDFTQIPSAGTYSEIYYLSGSNDLWTKYLEYPQKEDNLTIDCTPYTLSPARGEYIGEVKATEGTFPTNGEKNGYWYVLLN